VATQRIKAYLGTATVIRCYGTRGSTAMKKLIELLDDEDRIFAQQWADANVAVFASALLVEIFRGIVGLLFG
jgi:hypothetical protein